MHCLQDARTYLYKNGVDVQEQDKITDHYLSDVLMSFIRPEVYLSQAKGLSPYRIDHLSREGDTPADSYLRHRLSAEYLLFTYGFFTPPDRVRRNSPFSESDILANTRTFYLTALDNAEKIPFVAMEHGAMETVADNPKETTMVLRQAQTHFLDKGVLLASKEEIASEIERVIKSIVETGQ